MRVVIDTNVFVSGLLLPASVPGRIIAAAWSGVFDVVLSEAILTEVGMALRYPKLRKRIALTDAELDRYLQLLRYVAEIVDSAGVNVEVPGDKADEPILATLVAARADCLLTGDAVLLRLADRYPIMTPAQFVSRHLA